MALFEQRISAAVDELVAGGLVAFPTETVYGLGADASQPVAVRKIFQLKGRPTNHPLIVHLASADSLAAWCTSLTPQIHDLAEHFWPGPLTLILPKAPTVCAEVTGGQATIGVRVPAHPVAQDLLQLFNQRQAYAGIAAPSANRFGQLSPTLAAHVRANFAEQIPVLDGGACTVGIESTILDCCHERAVIRRPGAITAEALKHVLGYAPVRYSQHHQHPQNVANRAAQPHVEPPTVSGDFRQHYAPRTRCELIPANLLAERCESCCQQGQRFALLGLAGEEVCQRYAAKATSSRLLADAPATYAQQLYAALHDLDAAKCAVILVCAPPTGDASDAWAAISDRLSRATAN